MNRRELLKNTGLFMGYAISASVMSETFMACASTANLPWKPSFLTKVQAATVAEITETILPKTKTPGAKELGVPQFVDKMLKDCLGAEEQKAFLLGLAQFDADCLATYSKSFVQCDAAQRTAFLTKLDKEANKFPPSIWGIALAEVKVSYFRQLKELTLFGYYTSKKIGSEVLSYDPVPGAYIGCIPASEVGNAWNE